MRVFDKIYIAKYQNASTLWQLSIELNTTREEIDNVIEELNNTGKGNLYKDIPDEEWEKLENKTEAYVLSKYAKPIKSKTEIFKELINTFIPEKQNFQIYDSVQDEIKHRMNMIIVNEEWQPIKDFNYSVSNYGRVKNNTTNKFKHLRVGRYGYQINLWDKSKSKMFTMSRLVANYFIREVKENERVRHIDGDIRNNYYKNLEIVSK